MNKWKKEELINYCKKNGIKKYSKKTKEQLLHIIYPVTYSIKKKEYYIPSKAWENIISFCNGLITSSNKIKTKTKFMDIFQIIYEDNLYHDINNWLKKKDDKNKERFSEYLTDYRK